MIFCPRCGELLTGLKGSVEDENLTWVCKKCGYERKASLKRKNGIAKKQDQKKIDSFITLAGTSNDSKCSRMHRNAKYGHFNGEMI